MSYRGNLLHAGMFAAALAFSAGFATQARASDPLPGDAIQLPPNVNIGLLYNSFSDAGDVGAVHGSNTTDHVHISTDVTVLRYVRSFQLGPYIAGVQAYVPIVDFLGTQRVGAATPLGPARATLSKSSGFGQPNFGVFAWPYANPATGTFVPVGGWFSPPISSYKKDAALNPGSDSSLLEVEAGFRTELFGDVKGKNLAIEMWGEGYFFFDNTSSAAVSPTITFDNFPGLTIPQTVTPAIFHEQSSEEFRVYLPYTFFPAAAGTIAPGFFQSFGGKQTYRLNGGGTVDSGNRTDESQLRLVASMFLSPSTQVLAEGTYDLSAHGGPLNRSFTLRLAKFF